MSSDQPAQDTPAPRAPVKLGTLTTHGPRTWPASDRHRVINSCRSGHEEVLEVTTEAGLIEAMTAGCRYPMPDGRTCGALVVVSRHISPDGRELGMILIPDDPTSDLKP